MNYLIYESITEMYPNDLPVSKRLRKEQAETFDRTIGRFQFQAHEVYDCGISEMLHSITDFVREKINREHLPGYMRRWQRTMDPTIQNNARRPLTPETPNEMENEGEDETDSSSMSSTVAQYDESDDPTEEIERIRAELRAIIDEHQERNRDILEDL